MTIELLDELSKAQRNQAQRGAFQQALLGAAAGLLQPTRGSSTSEAISQGLRAGLGTFNQQMDRAGRMAGINSGIRARREANETARDRNQIARDQNEISRAGLGAAYKRAERPTQVYRDPKTGALVEKFADGTVRNAGGGLDPLSMMLMMGMAGGVPGAMPGAPGAVPPVAGGGQDPALVAAALNQAAQAPSGAASVPTPVPPAAQPQDPLAGLRAYQAQQAQAPAAPAPVGGGNNLTADEQTQFRGLTRQFKTPAEVQDYLDANPNLSPGMRNALETLFVNLVPGGANTPNFFQTPVR